MAAHAPLPPNLHVNCQPIQVGDQIMVQIQIGDNFGLAFTIVLPPKIANGFSKYLRDAVTAAETTLVKPTSSVLPA